MRKRILSLVAALTVMSAFLSGGGTFVTAFAAGSGNDAPDGYSLAYEYDFQNMTTDQLKDEGIKTTEYGGNTDKTNSELSIAPDGTDGNVLKVDSKADFGGVTFDISKHIDFFIPILLKLNIRALI